MQCSSESENPHTMNHFEYAFVLLDLTLVDKMSSQFLIILSIACPSLLLYDPRVQRFNVDFDLGGNNYYCRAL